jgi:perosamine synthetase
MSVRLEGAHALTVVNGTAALWVALQALDVGPGDEVIVPSLTYPAPANAAELLGAKVVPVDVCRDTAAMDVELVAQAVTEKTKVVLPVHPFGIAADMKGLRQICNAREGLFLVEDAACAMGAMTQEGPCGTLGDIACFSFHPRKVITTGEGGAVVTSDAVLAESMGRLRNHGQTHAETLSERFVGVGLNLRMGDIQGALGVVQMGQLDAVIAARRELCDRYAKALEGISNVSLLPGLMNPGSVVQSLIVILERPIQVGDVISRLRERGIESTVASYALHRLPYFNGKYGWTKEMFPVAHELSEQGLTLPLYPDMNPDDVDRVVQALSEEVEG